MQFISTAFRKPDLFSPASLKDSNDFFLDFSISIIWDRNFFPKSRVSFPLNTFSFSLSRAFAFLGSFVIIFKMLSRRVYATASEAWPKNKITYSTKVINFSTGTSTAPSDGALRMSSNYVHKRDKGPITSIVSPWNLSIWWSDVETVCESNKDLIKSSRDFTCWRFEGTDFSVNNCPSVSFLGI